MSLLVLGAGSRIAQEVCERFAARGVGLILAARNEDELRRLADHYRARHEVPVATVAFDATDFEGHDAFWQAVLDQHEEIEAALLAFGTLGDADGDRHDPAGALQTLQVNLDGAVSLLTRVADYLERRGDGVIAVIGSPAGDRGRQSNYVYGAAKAGLAVFAQGLRNRLAPTGVHVLTIKPGFVATPMTAGMDLPRLLTASPRRVARDIEQAMRKRRDVIYTPWFWRWILRLVRAVPEGRFKRLRM